MMKTCLWYLSNAFLIAIRKWQCFDISGSFRQKRKFKSSCLKQFHLHFKRHRKEFIQLRICTCTVKCWSNPAITSTRWQFEKLSYQTYTYKIVVFMHLISLQKWWPMIFINCLSYTLLECLTNWLSEIDCDSVLSIVCHEKYSKLFSTLKCSIGKCIAEVY